MIIPKLKKIDIALKPSRIEALTDGVFAIAMTLLVLNFDIQEPAERLSTLSLSAELLNLWPHFLHYVISFIILSSFWLSHHYHFHFIKHVDRNLIYLNIFKLMFICFIPFSTSLVGDFPLSLTAALIFEVNMLIAGLLSYWQWGYATKNHRLVEKDLEEHIIAISKQTDLVIPAISAVAIVFSIFLPHWGTRLYILIPLILLFFRKNA
ncbi:MAG: TMEM175 family protein [Pseudomonadota bacterium]